MEEAANERSGDLLVRAKAPDLPGMSSPQRGAVFRPAGRGRARPLADWRTPKGKPYFLSAPALHCSVTHSGDYWLGAFSDQPLGIDLQIYRKVRREAVSRRFFHPTEDAYLQSEGYRDFFRVWAAKESFVKCSGEGIDSGFGRFSVADSGGLLPRVQGQSLWFVPFREGYSLCVCTKEISSVTLLPGK